jgi:GntR family transcriptional regulator/MocR family aminotransferase
MDFAIGLDSSSGQPLHRQLYDSVRRAILAGRLGPGQRLPSTRAMADSLGLSRTTVTQSYDELISEGYLIAARGSGTFVCEELPEELLKSRPAASAGNSVDNGKKLRFNLSKYGQTLAAAPSHFELRRQAQIDFSYGHPDLDRVPLREWGRTISRYCRSGPSALLNYSSDPRGFRPLREAIARYLGASRAVQCSPDQVLIVSGAQQALDLICRITIDPGDAIAVENPGYPGSLLAFKSQGARPIAISVDAAGLVVDELSRYSHTKIKAVHVTPSHQFPTGAALSLPRRLELLSWAEQTGALIIEDDYDSEYRYSGRPIPALQGLSKGDSVAYIGTFSKVLFPSLRIGYVVAPEKLVPILARAKLLADRQSPYVEQYALADFINDGRLERHIRRMRTLYKHRRDALVRELTARLGERVSIFGENAGMHLMVRIATGMSDDEFIRRAEGFGVSFSPASHCYLDGAQSGEFILGFAGLGERKIREGVKRLAQALAS